MKRKVFIIGGLLIVGGIVFNVSFNSNKSKGLSDVTLSKVEALTSEIKKVTVRCDGTNKIICTTQSGASHTGTLSETTEYYYD